MRVLLVHNEPVLPPSHPEADAEHEIRDTVATVATRLAVAGLETVTLAVGRDPGALADGLRKARPDVVFNLFEGLADDPATEAWVAGFLERAGVPFTGSASAALASGLAKPFAKRLLRGAGLLTPASFVVHRRPAPPCRLAWPVFLKPAFQDGSVGIDQGSVATGPAAYEARIALLLAAYGGPVLVERFIPGRELSVGVVETPTLEALPPSEILFEGGALGLWPIVTYDGKWSPASAEYAATPPRYPAVVEPGLADRLRVSALRAFRALGCRDYARVDFRVPASGEPYVLEVNPNPDLSPNAAFAGGLGAAGLDYGEFLIGLVRAAAARGTPAGASFPGPPAGRLPCLSPVPISEKATWTTPRSS
ncbi:MAG: D-alanine--D-alanine ligase [Planctomycetes bacterium]|nr:D-alanine--D-alanine ligase [Planctomycetota bacterium]